MNKREKVVISRGGSRGRVQGVRPGGGGGGAPPPPPPWDDLRFPNTTGILPKQKKLCGLLVLKYRKRRVHPLLKKMLDPPLISYHQFRYYPFYNLYNKYQDMVAMKSDS